jgi:hypothetical protein
MNAGNHKQAGNPDPLEQRKKISFEQAAGVAPMPSQLARGEISQAFRAELWSLVRKILEGHRDHTSLGTLFLKKPWSAILAEGHVRRDHQFDDFPTDFDAALQKVKSRIEKAEW